MVPCYNCGFWDSDCEACACPSSDMWYACPIESKKPENIKALEEYIEWYESKKRMRRIQNEHRRSNKAL